MEKIKSFFYGVKKEIERVRWPNKKVMFKSSIAVLSLCAFLSLFFYVVNAIDVIIVWLKKGL